MLNKVVSQVSDIEGAATRAMEISASRPRSLISNTTWTALLALWTTSVNFFFTPFLIGHIGDGHYGLYVLLMSVNGLLGIMNPGLGEATLRYVARYYRRTDLTGINRVVGATLSVCVITALLGATALFFRSPWIASLLAIPAADLELTISLLRLMAINFGLALLNEVLGSIPQALQRFDINTKVMIARSAFQVVGSVVIVFFGLGLYGVILWIVITSVLALVTNTVVAKRLIPQLSLRPLPTKSGLKEIFSYSIFSVLTNILGMVWSQADRILLGILISASAVTYLTVPWNLAFRILGCMSQAGTVLFARFSAMKEFEDKKRLYLLATWTMLSITTIVFVPVTVLIPDFLRLWINPSFAEKSAYVGQVIAASCMVRGAFIPYEALFKGIGKPQYLTRLVLLTSLTSLVVNLALIPTYGLLGAGYSYCITPLWGFATVVFTWRYVLGARTIKPLVQTVALPILLGFVSLGVGLGIRSTLTPTLGWIGLGGVGILLLVLALILVVGAELVIGGQSSHIHLLSNYIRSFVFRRRCLR